MSTDSQNVNGFIRRYAILFCLVFAGEIIFSLPFHVARFFRPTLLSVFNLTNTGLRDVFAVFGLTATLVYFPGGMLADIFSARRLMALSLFATALGGIYMAQLPGHFGLSLLFGYWGITSILLFWSAMIKATREWGGESKQGSAFGLLDGGRGLVAALVATTAVAVLTYVLPRELSSISEAERSLALQSVIFFYSAVTFGASILVWFVVPDSTTKSVQRDSPFAGISDLFKKKTVWLQATVVVCAYCGYKGLDNFSLYAVDGMGMNELEAARYTSYAAYLRVISAIIAGFLANRFSASKVISSGFLFLVFSYLILTFAVPSQLSAAVLYGNIVITYCAVFALRGVYFALLGESKISKKETGAAVGIISLIGFTPDMFFTPIAGRILDASPGIEGHQNFFMLLVFISTIGLVTTIILRRTIR